MIIPLSVIPVQASDEAIIENDTIESDICESFDDIADIIFGDDSDASVNGTAQPLWGGGGHQSTVAEYGTNLTAFLKTMSKVPDDTKYTMYKSLSDANYLGLPSSGAISLSDNSLLYYNDTTYNFRQYAILHGRGNYVASLRFLYSVAKNLVDSSKSYSSTNNLQALKDAITDAVGADNIANGTFYGENKTYCNPHLSKQENGPDWVWASGTIQYINHISVASIFTSRNQRANLEKAMYLVANYHFDGQDEAYKEVLKAYNIPSSVSEFRVKTALKIIGIATHLCGDIYAHKTVVPLDVTFSGLTTVPDKRDNSTIYKGKEFTTDSNGAETYYDFNGKGRWSARDGIKTLINAGSTITTQQITQWQNTKETGYPDSTAFYNERLSVGAKQLVANMYDNFFNGSTLGSMGFYVNWFLHDDYTLKLANLKLYAYSIGSQPTMASRLTKLGKLDSAVAMSDVKPTGDYIIPSSTSSDNPWKKGYTSSY